MLHTENQNAIILCIQGIANMGLPGNGLQNNVCRCACMCVLTISRGYLKLICSVLLMFCVICHKSKT